MKITNSIRYISTAAPSAYQPYIVSSHRHHVHSINVFVFLTLDTVLHIFRGFSDFPGFLGHTANSSVWCLAHIMYDEEIYYRKLLNNFLFYIFIFPIFLCIRSATTYLQVLQTETKENRRKKQNCIYVGKSLNYLKFENWEWNMAGASPHCEYYIIHLNTAQKRLLRQSSGKTTGK